MTSFSLGVNTCFAVKRWPEPEAWAALVRDDLGLTLVQHSLDLVDLEAPAPALEAHLDRVRSACAGAGIALHSTFTGLAAYSSNLLLAPEREARDRALDWYRRVVDLTARLGAGATGGHIGAFSVADFRDPIRRAELSYELQDRLRELTARAREVGLDYLMIENLAAAREPSTMAGITELLDQGDAEHVPIRLCLDVGHQCVPGTVGVDRDPYAWLRMMAPFAPVIQLQQSDAAADHHWPFTDETNAKGRIEADKVLEAISLSGAADVALVLEVIPPFEEDDDQVVEDMVASVDYWRSALGA